MSARRLPRCFGPLTKCSPQDSDSSASSSLELQFDSVATTKKRDADKVARMARRKIALLLLSLLGTSCSYELRNYGAHGVDVSIDGQMEPTQRAETTAINNKSTSSTEQEPRSANQSSLRDQIDATGTEQSTRRMKSANSEIVSLEHRIRDTLKSRGIFKNGDDLEIKANNVKIRVGEVRFENARSTRGISRDIRSYTRTINRSSEKAEFDISDKADFDSTFAAVVTRGLKWSGGDIKAESVWAPEVEEEEEEEDDSGTETKGRKRGKKGGKRSREDRTGGNSHVKFSLSQSTPTTAQKTSSVSFRFDSINNPPRTKSIPKSYFQVVDSVAHFEVKVVIEAESKIRCKVTRNNRDTIILLSLKEALRPNQGGGFEPGEGSDSVIFRAKGRNYWTTSNKVFLQVEHVSVDDNEDIPYKTQMLETRISL